MSALQGALADYLATRRALGYKLERAEKLLRQFLVYLAEHEAETITVEHALAWATLPANASAHWLSYRLGAVRGFAVYLRTIDPACEVPPTDLLPGRSRRATPYIYSEAEIAALLEAAGTLSTSHRTATYRTLIGLLAATGMRIGEAIALDRASINWRTDLIVIRDTKFGKSRELPLYPSATAALRHYLRRGDRPPAQDTDAVFLSGAGTRLLYCGVQWTFARLLARAGIEPRSAECRPRLHDIRHTFAVWTIRDAYRDCEADVGPRLAALSTYLGHVDPSRTYWYLSAAPELMAAAADRLERHLGGDQ